MSLVFDQSIIERMNAAFGNRIQQYRKAAGITQQEFADLLQTSKSYISILEKGTANPSFELLVRYGMLFGVDHHQLLNPDYPIPTFGQLPAATRKAIDSIKKRRKAAKATAQKIKAVNKEEGVPGRAKQLHGLIEKGFFKRSRTAKEAFSKLHPSVTKRELHNHTEEIGKITATLSSGRFPKLLDKLEPQPGTTAVRFVAKDPSVVKYIDNPAGAKDIAADGGRGE